MARRKQEVALQQDVDNQEDFSKLLAKEGLVIVDVYQEWCGSCASMVSNLKRVRAEIADELLHFAAAKADTVECLERYRGKSQPCYHYYAGGYLVNVVRGANSPKICQTIVDELAYEKKVLAGNADRKPEYQDPVLAAEDDNRAAEAARRAEVGEDEGPLQKEVCHVTLLPQLLSHASNSSELVVQLKTALSEGGVELLKDEERQLTEEEAAELLAPYTAEEFYDELLSSLQSTPSHVFVLTKKGDGVGTCGDVRDLLKPLTQDVLSSAGVDIPLDGFHSSTNRDAAVREVALLFPEFEIPAAPQKPKMEKTVVVLPAATSSRSADLIAELSEFTVVQEKEIEIDGDLADLIIDSEGTITKVDEEEVPRESRIAELTSGPAIALCLEGLGAVERISASVGPANLVTAKEEAPESLGVKFQPEERQDEDTILIFIPRDVDVAKAWTKTIFGDLDKPAAREETKTRPKSEKEELEELVVKHHVPFTVAVMKPCSLLHRSDILEKIASAGLSIVEKKEVLLTSHELKEMYKQHLDADFWGALVDHMTSSESLFLVLSGDDAVNTWNTMMGSVDVDKAKEEHPESLRALYGESTLKNAVGGADDAETDAWLKAVFGDVVVTEEALVPVTEAAQAEETTGEERSSAERQEEAAPETEETSDAKQEEAAPETEETSDAKQEEPVEKQQTASSGSRPPTGDASKEEAAPVAGTPQEATTPKGATTPVVAASPVSSRPSSAKAEASRPPSGEKTPAAAAPATIAEETPAAADAAETDHQPEKTEGVETAAEETDKTITETTASKEATAVGETAASKEATAVGETAASKEATAAGETAASKEATAVGETADKADTLAATATTTEKKDATAPDDETTA